ncbi:MAG: DUF5009 domain-containing protein, partial [Saprospiraceae bacterium]|nr:DUF5009 domain-containing protein [Saprospiraceae bacterium]
LGIYTGELIKDTPSPSGTRVVLQLAITGIILIIVAQIWNLVFPINKNLWTSPFTLQCGGISMLLMALFYYIIDIRGYHGWAFFFKVIGMNSILIYLSGHFINWSYTTNAFFKWLGQLVGDPYNVVVMVFCFLAVKWAFLYFMYRQKIFLRV